MEQTNLLMNAIKKIMVLAGGNDQIALIEELRKKFYGVYIYLVDFAENPVAKPYADEHLCISTMDREAVLKAAKEKMIDMIIITCGDQPLPIMAYVAEQLHLPTYLSLAQTLNLTNKVRMKEIMVKNNIPTAKHVICTSINSINTKDLRFPLIVKPADCNGSKGVRKVQNEQELLCHLNKALEYSRTHTAIVEEFKTGVEISVDAYVQDGCATVLMMSQLNKYFVNESTQVICQSTGPAPISETAKRKIEDITNNVATAFGLINCPLLIQLIVQDDEVNVIELSARIGGGAKYDSIYKVTGFNVLSANIDAFFGIKPNLILNQNPKYYVRCHLYTYGGVFREIIGVEDLLKEGVVDSVTYTKSKGSTLNFPSGSSDRVASVFILGNSFEDINKRVQKAIQKIKIYDIEGKDILYREMFQK